MKSLRKIIARSILLTATISLLLVVVNIIFTANWAMKNPSVTHSKYDVGEIADGLANIDGTYSLNETATAQFNAQYSWAMLIGQDGNVVWSKNLPADVPLIYTLTDIATFTRWYLNDYPVSVWESPDGLIVLGEPKGSIWKYPITSTEATISQVPSYLGGFLILNLGAALILALLLGLWLYRKLKPLYEGITALQKKETILLPTKGVTGEVARILNETSVVLKEQGKRLADRDKTRTEWIAGVSHDIRTPLSMVMGYSSQLETNPNLLPAEQDQAKIIREQSQRIKTLVADLNIASKLEYEMQPLHLSKISPAAMLRSISADYINNGLSDPYSISLKATEDSNGLSLLCDEALVHRAVTNLIDNSIRHNGSGCIIDVSVKKHPDGCIIKISDDGKGYPPEVLVNSDEPVFLENHGLGLIIVRRIMKLHGGKATFENPSSGGCSVSLIFNQ
ncbi:sensor histidine kinase [Acetobacterium paludosum]|uniref:histidine kinase n=1 Tax=Acetobacterium paludosum TaxID=52693 RepID=A0A923HYT7_9FIRM|nr:HAMP domain-containing sensor histidine kinase [Acetobacterium paludosum]MBC3888506.1 sensor histidine kinase [Acetobacterium paludosum]